MDGRSPACLLVLCGLPAVGKTSLAQAVLDHLVQSGAPIKAFHVCFDHYINKELMGNSELERAELSGAPGPGQVVMGTLEPKRGELRESPEVEQLTLQGASFKIERGDSRVFPVKPLQGDWRETPELERGDTGETLKREWAEPTGSPELEWAGFSPELWKRARRLAIQKVEELLREANEKEGPLAQRTLVIADDNFHLRSMRRELYVLARTLRAAIVFLYATTVLETSLSRNALRPPGKQVPKESILRMAATFEPPGQSAFLVGGCTGTSSRVCQSEGAEVHTEGGPDVLKGGPQSLEPAETKDGLELKRATSNPALDVSSHEASKTWKPGASREAELFGGGKEQGPSRPLTNRAADYSSDSSKGAEARRGMAGIARDGESALPERGQKGRTWEAPVVIIDTSVERGRTERAAEVWHRVWDAWGQAPEEPPDRAEEEAKRAAAVAATADSILHALDLRTRRALSSAMLDADKTGRHVIVDKKTLAQPLNRRRAASEVCCTSCSPLNCGSVGLNGLKRAALRRHRSGPASPRELVTEPDETSGGAMATQEDQCTQNPAGLHQRHRASLQRNEEEQTDQEIRQSSAEGQEGPPAKESRNVESALGPTLSKGQLMPDGRQRRRKGSRSRKRGQYKTETDTNRGNRADDQEGTRTKDRGNTESQKETLKSFASDSEANLTVHSRDRHASSILSSPTEWDPEGPKDVRPYRRYFESKQDESAPSTKSVFEVQGFAGAHGATPPASSDRFLQRAGKLLDRVFPVMHPLSHFMAIENLIFGLLVLYSLFSVTYQIGFDQTPQKAWLYFETAVDAMYYVDCVIQFRVGYFSGTKLPASAQKRMIELGGAIPNTVMDGRRVAWHYFTHWFFVDFASSFPFDIVFAYIKPNRPWSLQFFMLLKLLRLPRFWRARSQLRRFFSQSQDEIISLFTTIIFIFFYCHLSGCVFWYIVQHEHTPNNFAELATWDDNGVDRPLQVAPPEITYLAVLYFLVVSFASVGYGDLHPSGAAPERIWAIFNGAISAICLGYVVGKITSLVFTRSERRMQLRERFDVLHRVVEREKLPEMLAVRMTQQLATIWESKIYRYNEEEMFNELPPHLRAEFLATWWIRHIKPSALFPHYFPYLRAILSQANRQLSPPGDYVVREGQISRSLYVVWKGHLVISSSRAVESHEPNEDLCNDPEGDWKNGGFRSAPRQGRRRSWTKEKASQIKEWFTRTKHRGDDFSVSSDATDVSSADDWDSTDSETAERGDHRSKRHWEVGAGTIIGERALMNELARRMRERGPDWERIRVSSINMDVTARSIDETYILRILIDDLIIDDFPPLLEDLMEALKHYEYTPPGVKNRDT
ncbi:Voltage-gated shaker-like K+ channel subunit beta [Klebsormidium nitens]|uniref:Voltage-gated shaker-like K+ channel subunit beta n=1 Tax=Klebsormidium nitens TaxID=105231 RepID=A0A1Y1HQT6_KLENI|nr:Voltage-gated shaker-like K+ channel subunit beta [Klebsormidium nitens]|eukprot:GAQ78956.1 Voltage-gated shaker-like K+ channel subunit beta [Klebsormidium nitens]